MARFRLVAFIGDVGLHLPRHAAELSGHFRRHIIMGSGASLGSGCFSLQAAGALHPSGSSGWAHYEPSDCARGGIAQLNSLRNRPISCWNCAQQMIWLLRRGRISPDANS